jgi:hypothetical protein
MSGPSIPNPLAAVTRQDGEPVDRIVWQPAEGTLPMARIERGSKIGGTVALVLGGTWCALMGNAGLDALAEDALPGKLLMLALFASPGVLTVLYGIGQFLYRHEIAVDNRQVTVTRTGLLGRRQWREPVPAYKGVLKQTRLDMPAEESWQIASTYEYILKLAHARRDREVLLYEASSRLPVAPEAREFLWKRYAELFQLPLLEDKD